MLVLNTNNSGNGGYDLSNQVLGMYPDFKNSALLFTDNVRTVPNNEGIPNGFYVDSVNGTHINNRLGNVVAPNYYIGINGNTSGQMGIVSSPTSNEGPRSITKRFGLGILLNGGEVIGKECYFQRPLFVLTSNSGYYTMNNTFKYTVQLLHTDGTLTEVQNSQFSFTGVNTSGYGNVSCTKMEDNTTLTMTFQSFSGLTGDEYKTSNGVVAQAGDRIVVDLYYYLNGHKNSSGTSYSTTTYFGVFLGYLYTTDNRLRSRGVQVSID